LDRLLIYLGRFAVIIIGYFLAALAASAAMHLLILPTLGFSRNEAAPIVTGAVVFSVPFVALFVGYYALLPSLVVIAIAEIWSVRGWLFHALGGGAVGLVVAMLFRATAPDDILAAGSDLQVIPPSNSIFDPNLLAVMIGSGMIGGLAYWLIAGRSSGSWREAAGPTSPGR
jgi:hypothetical protein